MIAIAPLASANGRPAVLEQPASQLANSQQMPPAAAGPTGKRGTVAQPQPDGAPPAGLGPAAQQAAGAPAARQQPTGIPPQPPAGAGQAGKRPAGSTGTQQQTPGAVPPEPQEPLGAAQAARQPAGGASPHRQQPGTAQQRQGIGGPQGRPAGAGQSAKQPAAVPAAQTASPAAIEMQRIRVAKAANFEGLMPAVYLQLGMNQIAKADPDVGTYHAYFAQLLADAGDITDPIERMLVEAIAIAFHRSGQLLVKSASAENLQASAMYNAATTKMLAEFRRLTLSLEAYRASVAARSRADGASPAGTEKKAPKLRCG
jgi:hypothetical protein